MAHFLVYNVLAKFQLFCIITYRDILYFVFWLPYCHTLRRHQYLICIIQKSWISLEWNEVWQKGKRHSSSLLKAFQIRPFFNTSIFHFIGTLTATHFPQYYSAKFEGINKILSIWKSMGLQAWLTRVSNGAKSCHLSEFPVGVNMVCKINGINTFLQGLL